MRRSLQYYIYHLLLLYYYYYYYYYIALHHVLFFYIIFLYYNLHTRQKKASGVLRRAGTEQYKQVYETIMSKRKQILDLKSQLGKRYVLPSKVVGR